MFVEAIVEEAKVAIECDVTKKGSRIHYYIICQTSIEFSEQVAFTHDIFMYLITLNNGCNILNVERKLPLEYVKT
jgi:hypothetical protein